MHLPLAELGWLAAAQALEARGYDSEMAKLALEQVDYQSEDHAALLLDEWNGGPPAPAIGSALPRSGSALTGASEAEEELPVVSAAPERGAGASCFFSRFFFFFFFLESPSCTSCTA